MDASLHCKSPASEFSLICAYWFTSAKVCTVEPLAWSSRMNEKIMMKWLVFSHIVSSLFFYAFDENIADQCWWRDKNKLKRNDYETRMHHNRVRFIVLSIVINVMMKNIDYGRTETTTTDAATVISHTNILHTSSYIHSYTVQFSRRV